MIKIIYVFLNLMICACLLSCDNFTLQDPSLSDPKKIDTYKGKSSLDTGCKDCENPDNIPKSDNKTTKQQDINPIKKILENQASQIESVTKSQALSAIAASSVTDASQDTNKEKGWFSWFPDWFESEKEDLKDDKLKLKKAPIDPKSLHIKLNTAYICQDRAYIVYAPNRQILKRSAAKPSDLCFEDNLNKSPWLNVVHIYSKKDFFRCRNLLIKLITQGACEDKNVIII